MNRAMKLFFGILACVLAWILAPPSPADAHEAAKLTDVKIGVLAKRGPEKALNKWNATAAYLDANIPGHHFHIIPMTFDEIPVLVDNQLVDFVIVNPAIYVDLSVRFGVRRLVTLKNRLSPNYQVTQFGSVVFTQADQGNLDTFQDLHEREVAAVHRTSLGGWIMALREFNEAGVTESDLSALKFFETHDAVVMSVLNRRADVGIVRTDTLERMSREGTIDIDDFKIIAPKQAENFPFSLSTRLYPEWPISKVKHTSNVLAKAVARALIQLPPEHPAADAADIQGWTIPENYQPVHEILQVMSLSPYTNFGEVSLSAVIQAYRYWFGGFLLFMVVLALLSVRIVRLNRTLDSRQHELASSEERFRATFEQAAVGMAHASAEGMIVMTNQKLSEMVGYSEYELRKLNLNDLTDPDDLTTEMQHFNALRQGDVSHFTVQKRLVGKEGKRCWAQQTVSSVRNENGEIKNLVVVMDDIEKNKALERTIDHEQKQRNLILDIAGDGILGLDCEGRHTFVNPAAARMLGWDVEDLLGRHSHKIWHHSKPDGSHFPEEECPITGVLRKGNVHRGFDETFWTKDGKAFPTEYVSTPIVEDGVVTGAVVVFREVGASTRTRAKAEEVLSAHGGSP